MKQKFSKKYDFIVDESNLSEHKQDIPFLYNDNKYLNVWNGRRISFYLLNKQSNRFVGQLKTHIVSENAWSPYKAPFSSFHFSEDLDFAVISSFIDFCIGQCNQAGVKKFFLKHYPDFYSSNSADKIISALFVNGFQIKSTDINHHLELTDTFESNLHKMEKRRLNKCTRTGFLFTINSNKEVESVFKEIQLFRSQKNIPLNIDYKEMKQLIHLFPEKYKSFTITNNSKIIAATLTVVVRDDVIYHFLPASDPEYDNFSPMVLLVNGIYKYGLENNFRYLDMGVSSINGNPQIDLIQFKERLGCKTGIKFSFEYNF